MKKFVVLLCVLCLMVSSACAETKTGTGKGFGGTVKVELTRNTQKSSSR